MALLTIGFTGITIILLPLLVISAQQFDPMEICRGKPNNATVMNPLSCDSFLLCSDGLPAGTGQCPSEMLFNAEKEICNFPENVNCGSVPLPTQFQTSTEESTEMITDLSVETTTSSVPNESCPQIDDPVSPLYMSIPDNCTNYIMCYHGTPLIMQCPIGTEWNKNNSICDTPENAKCQASFQDPFGCPVEGTKVLPHPTNCEKFVFCLNGISRVQVCQMFKYFDPVAGECVLGKC